MFLVSVALPTPAILINALLHPVFVTYTSNIQTRPVCGEYKRLAGVKVWICLDLSCCELCFQLSKILLRVFWPLEFQCLLHCVHAVCQNWVPQNKSSIMSCESEEWGHLLAASWAWPFLYVLDLIRHLLYFPFTHFMLLCCMLLVSDIFLPIAYQNSLDTKVLVTRLLVLTNAKP